MKANLENVGVKLPKEHEILNLAQKKCYSFAPVPIDSSLNVSSQNIEKILKSEQPNQNEHENSDNDDMPNANYKKMFTNMVTSKNSVSIGNISQQGSNLNLSMHDKVFTDNMYDRMESFPFDQTYEPKNSSKSIKISDNFSYSNYNRTSYKNPIRREYLQNMDESMSLKKNTNSSVSNYKKQLKNNSFQRPFQRSNSKSQGESLNDIDNYNKFDVKLKTKDFYNAAVNSELDVLSILDAINLCTFSRTSRVITHKIKNSEEGDIKEEDIIKSQMAFEGDFAYEKAIFNYCQKVGHIGRSNPESMIRAFKFMRPVTIRNSLGQETEY